MAPGIWSYGLLAAVVVLRWGLVSGTDAGDDMRFRLQPKLPSRFLRKSSVSLNPPSSTLAPRQGRARRAGLSCDGRMSGRRSSIVAGWLRESCNLCSETLRLFAPLDAGLGCLGGERTEAGRLRGRQRGSRLHPRHPAACRLFISSSTEERKTKAYTENSLVTVCSID